VRLLNCVISYNRYYYLRNTLESLSSFFPFGDTIVIDNDSSDPILLQYLEELEASSRCRIVRNRRERGEPGTFDPGRPGFWEAVEYGIRQAVSGEYDYVQLIEDDVQFMWYDPTHMDKIHQIFTARSDCLWLSSLFVDRLDPAAEATLELIDDPQCYRSRTYSQHSTGFLSVKRVKETGYRFVDSNEAEKKWAGLGFRAYVMATPVVAWVPWASGYRSGKLVGSLRPPVQEYYLKPLDERQIDRLRERTPKELPFDDIYCHPWGWATLRPYASYLRNDRDYAKRLLAQWKRGIRIIPRYTATGRPEYIDPPPTIYFGIIWYILRALVDRLLKIAR